ncbi:hypothetical protein EW145_g4193 [Phellinidium pouzarii]|uniref:Uncharacterized protein n=1 Tax=Phellinidium pouzarii TaxID=167371 RepID=A0A4S4L696_9AGAM|nr:hypothetical protein EW145_g4193 [Phellinidium pouzarii]
MHVLLFSPLLILSGALALPIAPVQTSTDAQKTTSEITNQLSTSVVHSISDLKVSTTTSGYIQQPTQHLKEGTTTLATPTAGGTQYIEHSVSATAEPSHASESSTTQLESVQATSSSPFPSITRNSPTQSSIPGQLVGGISSIADTASEDVGLPLNPIEDFFYGGSSNGDGGRFSHYALCQDGHCQDDFGFLR